jgi:ankyrin repeat protein
MKHLLLTTIAAVVLVGCGESQQSAPSPETKPVEPVAEVAQPEPPTTKAPDISIHKAAEDGNIEAVKQHLAAGTDVNAKDGGGWTPLHHAAYGGHKEIFEILIANGADVNAKMEDGDTPLDMAIKRRRTETADLIRKHGGKTKKELEAEAKK